MRLAYHNYYPDKLRNTRKEWHEAPNPGIE